MARRLYVCGGCEGHLSLNTAERLNVASGVWETLPNMAERRQGAAAAALSGHLFVCGGNTGQFGSAEFFDPAKGVWQRLPNMTERRKGPSGAVVAGSLYVCGGHTGQQPLGSVERYDNVARTWEGMPPMAQRRWRAAAA